MSHSIQQLLNAFDTLPEGEKHQAAMEILCRVSPAAEGDAPESALIKAAEELFRALDAEEAELSPLGPNLLSTLNHDQRLA